jgi:hypothetical protein
MPRSPLATLRKEYGKNKGLIWELKNMSKIMEEK